VVGGFVAEWPPMPFRRLVVAVLLCSCVGCARPYAGPKTLAAIGTGLLAGGAVTWVAGERGNHENVATAGLITSLVGTAVVIAAGGWLAIGVSCQEDPDCPRNEECREIPAPPGGYPYRQCMPHSGP